MVKIAGAVDTFDVENELITYDTDDKNIARV